MTHPTLTETTQIFAKIGVLSFGGPAAQISLMHRILVDEKRWLTEQQYLSALSFCMLLPGPEAMQLATYAGWRIHGTLGGLIAGLLFVIPGAFVVLALSFLYATFGEVPFINALFLGVKAAVLIIVIEALLRVSKKALASRGHWVVAALAFVGIFFLALPYPLIILAAALYGFFFATQSNPAEQPKITVSALRTLGTIGLWLFVWWAPIFVLNATTDIPILAQIGTFFSKLAIVTFGGAYAVLAYMGQEVVTQLGWLSTGQMMDGLGLAETTPGPLILVTEFVGFIAGYNQGGLAIAIAAAGVTLWVTFTPCFLWIFAGAPYIEWISAQPRLSGALTAITAAVVGVILNLSLWFGLHVLFETVTHTRSGIFSFWIPDLSSINWRVLGLSFICAVLLLKLHKGIPFTLFVAGLGGLLFTIIF